MLQHGQTPLAGVTPIVRIRDDGGSVVKSFTATPTGTTGVYHAIVRFPAEGSYSYEVYDGFTQYGGAQTHTFKPVVVGPADGGLPYAWLLTRVLGSPQPSRRRRPWCCAAAARAGADPTEGGCMKRLFVFVATVVAALAVTAAANAGCMATVGLSSTPKPGLAAGKPWVVTIRVLQHGVRPMPDAKPEVRIRNAAGKLFTFKARKTDVVGSYRARVVFPMAGRYSLGVYDGFPVAECARVHTFKPVLIVAV